MKEIFSSALAGIPEGGVCAQTDPELFFPEKGGSTKRIKRLCIEECSVREECLQGALERNEKFGIWGGLTEKERRRLLGKKAVS